MKKNPRLDVPCHRVVMSNGSIGGFRGIRWKEKNKFIKKRRNKD